MLTNKPVYELLDELSSPSPAPGGGSVAALAGALGSALTSMVCNLTIGKKKYIDVEENFKNILEQSETLRAQFTELIEKDTTVFNKVMEAFSLPKDNDEQKALRSAAIQSATKEATLVPLEVMKHCIDALALTKAVAETGNINSVSDAGVSAIMLTAAAESAELNVLINLKSITNTEFVGWKSEEVKTIMKTIKNMNVDITRIVKEKIW